MRISIKVQMQMQFFSLVPRTTQNLPNASQMQMQMQNLTTYEPGPYQDHISNMQCIWLKLLHFSYVRVRYEDLVPYGPHTKVILDDLYKFMGMPWDLEAQNKTLEGLMHGGSTTGKYFSTSRDKDFDPNHWKKELSREVYK